MNDEPKPDGANDHLFEQASAFQKIWLESFQKMAQAAFTFSPDSAPPEMLRQIRTSIFQALASSWDEFLRSPQFLESMKQMMSGAIAFRKLTTEMLTRTQHELQGTSKSDVDALMTALHHLEQRLMDRTEVLERELKQVQEKLRHPARSGRTRRPPKTAKVPRTRARAAAGAAKTAPQTPRHD